MKRRYLQGAAARARRGLILAALAVFGALGLASSAAAQQLDRLSQIGPHFEACFAVSAELRAGGRSEVTVLFTLRRDGSLAGEPHITYVSAPRDSAARRSLAEAALGAVKACAPAPLSPSLGAAIAGRRFAMRFIVERDRIGSVNRIEQQRLAPDARAVSPLQRPERRPFEGLGQVSIDPRVARPQRWTDPPPPPLGRGQQDEVLVPDPRTLGAPRNR